MQTLRRDLLYALRVPFVFAISSPSRSFETLRGVRQTSVLIALNYS